MAFQASELTSSLSKRGRRVASSPPIKNEDDENDVREAPIKKQRLDPTLEAVPKPQPKNSWLGTSLKDIIKKQVSEPSQETNMDDVPIRRRNNRTQPVATDEIKAIGSNSEIPTPKMNDSNETLEGGSEVVVTNEKKGKGGPRKPKTAAEPANWRRVWRSIALMRGPGGPAYNATVDTMGCGELGEASCPPKDFRFQTLVALMLSSQTRDECTHAAVNRLRNELPGGLTVDSMLAASPDKIRDCISKVSFFNNKVNYLKKTAQMLKDNFNGDIPATVEGLISLPGVGPKMAHLCVQTAWGKCEGIGVDVHVHRITNRLGWHKTKTPEETRECLQSWLPRELWTSINVQLVGFGQTVCRAVGPKCDICHLSWRGLCPYGNSKKRLRPEFKQASLDYENGLTETPPDNGFGGLDRPSAPLIGEPMASGDSNVTSTHVKTEVTIDSQEQPLSMDSASSSLSPSFSSSLKPSSPVKLEQGSHPFSTASSSASSIPDIEDGPLGTHTLLRLAEGTRESNLHKHWRLSGQLDQLQSQSQLDPQVQKPSSLSSAFTSSGNIAKLEPTLTPSSLLDTDGQGPITSGEVRDDVNDVKIGVKRKTR